LLTFERCGTTPATSPSPNSLPAVAAASFVFGTILFVSMSCDRREPPQAVAEREPQRQLEGPPTAQPTDTGENRAAISDPAEILRRRTPRTVSEEQAKNAAAVLRGFPLDQKPLAESIRVLALDGDPEAADYAIQLRKVLEGAGWATTMGTTKERYIGVMCLVDNASQFPLHARVLTFAFERAGITCTAANKDAAPSDRIEIVVGMQPRD
jgi:hypothetical protein